MIIPFPNTPIHLFVLKHVFFILQLDYSKEEYLFLLDYISLTVSNPDMLSKTQC